MGQWRQRTNFLTLSHTPELTSRPMVTKEPTIANLGLSPTATQQFAVFSGLFA